MKTTPRATRALLLAALTLAAWGAPAAPAEAPASDFEYKIKDEKVTLTKYTGKLGVRNRGGAGTGLGARAPRPRYSHAARQGRAAGRTERGLSSPLYEHDWRTGKSALR